MLLIYDGDCDFCTWWARWATTRLPSDTRVKPWQALELEALELSQQEVEAALWWLEDTSGRDSLHCYGAQAVGRVLLATTGSWRTIGWLIIHKPLCWLADPVYTIVATNRRHLSRLCVRFNR